MFLCVIVPPLPVFSAPCCCGPAGRVSSPQNLSEKSKPLVHISQEVSNFYKRNVGQNPTMLNSSVAQNFVSTLHSLPLWVFFHPIFEIPCLDLCINSFSYHPRSLSVRCSFDLFLKVVVCVCVLHYQRQVTALHLEAHESRAWRKVSFCVAERD